MSLTGSASGIPLDPGLDPNMTLVRSPCEPLVNITTQLGYNPDLGTTHFPLGVARARLEDFSARFFPGEDVRLIDSDIKPDLSIEYWDKFMDEYCVPTAVLRLCLINQETKQWQKFDLERSLIKHFLYGLYLQHMRIMRGHFREIHEYTCDPLRPPPPPTRSFLARLPEPLFLGLTTHIVESEQVMNLIGYENGWQCQMMGKMRALLTPYTTLEHVTDPSKPDGPRIPRYVTSLRLQYLSFLILAHELYMPFEELTQRLNSSVVPNALVEQIIEYGLQREKEREREREQKQEPNHEIKSNTPLSAPERHGVRDHPQEDSSSQSSASRILSPATSFADSISNGGHQIPIFKLPRPKISTLRYIDEYGVPNASIPVLNVSASYLPQMIECITQLSTLMDSHIYDDQDPLQSVELFYQSQEDHPTSLSEMISDTTSSIYHKFSC